MKKIIALMIFVIACVSVSWADLIPILRPEQRLKECQNLGFKTPQNERGWRYMECDDFTPQELAANLTREKRLNHCARLTDYPATRPENEWYNCSEFSNEELAAAKQELETQKRKPRNSWRTNMNNLRRKPRQNTQGAQKAAPEVPFVKENVAEELKPLPAEEKTDEKPAKPVTKNTK